MPATIKDLARETGLGLATISSYLNGGNVRESNRIKIEAAIEKQGYVINEMARGLKTNKSMTIGIVVPELKSNFFAKIISEAEDILRHNGYSVIVTDCRTNFLREQEAIEFLIRKRVDGIILAPVSSSSTNLQSAIQNGKSIVQIDRKIDKLPCDSVSVDNIDAMYKAVDALVEKGHRRIGYIGGPRDVYTAAQRTLGFRKAMEENGLEATDRLIAECDYSIQGGRESMIALLQANPDMTAVIATNDETTIGCMIAVNELEINIPKDLSIIGFDHEEFSRAFQPQLTIISQPSIEIARCSSELLLKRLAGDTSAIEHVKLSTSIISGRSIRQIN